MAAMQLYQTIRDSLSRTKTPQLMWEARSLESTCSEVSDFAYIMLVLFWIPVFIYLYLHRVTVKRIICVDYLAFVSGLIKAYNFMYYAPSTILLTFSLEFVVGFITQFPPLHYVLAYVPYVQVAHGILFMTRLIYGILILPLWFARNECDIQLFTELPLISRN